MIRSFTRLTGLLVLLAQLLLLPQRGQAQNLTQADFTGVLVPQYLSNGNNSAAAFAGPRLAVVFRATLSNLTPGTAYRYYVLAAQPTELGSTSSGAGTVLLLTAGATPAASTYAAASTGSLTTAGSYATFTTDASGTYTGWFGFVNSNNANRFQTAGTVLLPTITLATDAAPATIVARRALNQSLTVLAFTGAAGAANGTLLTGASAATPKNLVFTYDNEAGTGRPLSSALVESTGVVTGTSQTGTSAYTYGTAAGAYTTVLPNTLPTGLRRLEQRSIVDGSLVGCAADADGTWPSGTGTVNPAGGPAALTLTATDAPLNTTACGTAPTTTPTLTATPAGPLTFSTTVGAPSAAQTVTVGGTNLTAGLTVTASSGYEVALAAGGPYAASLTVAAPAGTAPATPVYVRLSSPATPGAVNGTLSVASAGAASQTVSLTGAVTVAVAAPTISSFTPTSGAAGTVVTLTGTGFVDVSSVKLNGLAITGYTVVNATTITFTVPAGAGSGVISVTTPGGTATSAGSFTVPAAPVPPAPTLTALSPARVLAGGPDVVLTLTGTNLTAATTVSFNGATYQAASVSSAGTSLTVSIPARVIATAGAYPLTVTNAGGTSAALTLLVVAPATTVAYEDFEQGTKASYVSADVTLRSGPWTFTEALLGDQLADRVNQLRGARVRGGGSIAMKFDKPNGAGIVTISAALYGSDTGPTFTAEVSTDGGATYQPIAGTPATLTSTLTPYPLTVNRTGNVRLRFLTTNAVVSANPRLNFDDLTITDFTATASRAGQALPGLAVYPVPTREQLRITLPQPGAARVALRDLAGRLVLAPAALPPSGRLTLPAALPAGTYLLEVRQGTETAVRRVVKE